MSLEQAIGSTIRQTRDNLQISLDELAANASVDASVLVAQEEGRALLSISKLDRVAAVLGLDAAALYEGRPVLRPSPSVFFRRTGVPDFFDDDRPLLGAALEAAIALVEVDSVLGIARSVRAGFAPVLVGDVPYDDGYHLARLVRRALGNIVDPIGDPRSLLEEHFEIAVCVAPLRTSRILAATIKDSTSGAVAVLLNESVRSPLVTRVSLSHELAHALFDPASGLIDVVVDRDEPEGTRGSAGEQRAKAFAAELLLPKLGLEARFGGPRGVDRIDEASTLIDEARGHFLAPVELTVNHLMNQKYIWRDKDFRKDLIQTALLRPNRADQAAMASLPAADGRSSIVLLSRVREAHERLLITDGRARELLGLSVHDDLPWEGSRDARSSAG